MYIRSRRVFAYVFPSLFGLTSLLSAAGEVPAGAGSYTTEKPSHRWQPATAEGYDQTVPEGQPWGIYTPRKNQHPDVTQFFKSTGKPTPTHEFWSSVLWEFSVKNLIRNASGGVIETDTSSVPYSHWMTNSPFTMKFTNRGVNLTYAQTPLLVPYRYEDPNSDKRVLPSTSAPQFTAYTYPARIDPSLDPLGGTELNIQFDGLNASKTLLDDYSDFSARVLLNNPGTDESSSGVRVTMVNGSPYLHFQKTGLGNVTFTYFNGMRIIHQSNGTLGLYLGDVRSGYAIFAPAGTQFNYTLANLDLKELTSRGKITMTLPAGQTHFSVAILPNEINDIFKAPTQYTEQGYVVRAGDSVNTLPTHISGTHSPLVVARLVGDFFRNDTAGDGVGVEELDNLILDYRAHAFAMPVNTQFSYQYNANQALVQNRYQVDTQLSQTETNNDPSLLNQTLMGLYRHQYINTQGLSFPYTYSTPRGVMKVIKGNQFTTQVQHPGLIPNLPNRLEGEELNRLLSLLNKDKLGQWSSGLTQNDVLDTYNNGKELNWMVQLLHIAQQTGETATATTLMNKIKEHLEDWLSADDWKKDIAYSNSHCEPMAEPQRSDCYRNLRLANEKKYFYYNAEWNSLTGFPASFGSDTELNDHHFHAGYLISAAAAIARYDHAWATQWKPMVDLLIKDSANWDHTDTRFQFLRYFDIYNGYSLANGHNNMDAGGNQESSSESINFAQAVALWGSETGDTSIRDLGVFLYASEIQAIHQYWFDVDSQVFPKKVFWDDGSQFVAKDFDRASVGLVWHSKADYGTWFSAAPRMIAGINFLPITGASLHLGQMKKDMGSSRVPSIKLIMDRLPENTRFFAQDLWHKAQPAGFEQYDFRRKAYFWDDLMWEAQALVDPDAAATAFTMAGDYKREFDPSLPALYPAVDIRGEAGESKTHTYHWIFNLRALGTPVAGITANTPHFAVFEKNGVRKHVAYNPTNQVQQVSFSDGTQISLQPHELSGGTVVDVPPAVTNLGASNLDKTSADISWNTLIAPWADASYTLVVSQGGQVVLNQTAATSPVHLSNLSPDTNYSVTVVASARGLTGRTATYSFTTPLDLSVIPPVKNLLAQNVSQNGAQLSWDAISSAYNPVDYQVQLRNNGTLVLDLSSTQGLNQNNLTNLTPDTNYQVSVTASRNGIKSLPTTTEFRTQPVQPSCDPLVQTYCLDATATSVRITLNRNAVWADIRLTSPSLSGGYRMPQTNSGKSYFDVTGLKAGDVVSFEFTYFDTVGHDLGRYTYTHKGDSSGNPPTVTNLTSSNVTQTSATISWTPLSSEYAGATYKVDVTKAGAVISSQVVSGSNLTLTGLTALTNYQVSVVAQLNGKSSTASQTSFTTKDSITTPPNCQTLSGKQVCVQSSNGTLTLSLQASGWAIVHTSSGNYSMSAGADGNFTYQFRNLSNGSSISAWFTINTPTGAMDTVWGNFLYEENTTTIPPITGLQTTSINDSSVSLSWTAPTLETGTGPADYRVTLFNGTSIQQTLSSTNGQTSGSFLGLASGTEYRAEVVTLVGGKASAPTSVTFTTTGTKVITCGQKAGDICANTQGTGLRISVYGASGWAIIHYSAGNYMMTQGNQGEFYFDVPNIPVGGSINAWFTINTLTGAYDTKSYQLTRTN